MKRTIVHIAYDVTDVIHEGMDENEIKEYFADTPEVIKDAQWIGVVKVEEKE